MVETYVYIVEGVDLKGDVPPIVRRSAMRAVNRATSRARTKSSRAIREIAALPASYLSGSNGRLSITEKATMRSLQSEIVGRRRATSLARYTNGKVLTPQQQRRREGIRVTVKPGVAKFIRRGFLIKLRGADGDLLNVGLAVRTNGGPPAGAFKPKKISENLWLLYGLSVDTLFKRVIGPLTPEIEDELADEFDRLLTVEGL